MEFELSTADVQRLTIALIYAKAEWEQKSYPKAWLNSADKLSDIFCEVNKSLLEEHDYRATFKVTF